MEREFSKKEFCVRLWNVIKKIMFLKVIAWTETVIGNTEIDSLLLFISFHLSTLSYTHSFKEKRKAISLFNLLSLISHEGLIITLLILIYSRKVC